jgi:trimethylamine--corrinoid protein Co-methyltransferase
MSDGTRPRFSMLTRERIEQIIGEAMQTLAEVGVSVENDDAIELLSASGARVSPDGKRAFIPERLARECIASVPGSFTLYDREGEKVCDVGGDTTSFDPGSAAISIYDFNTRTIRKPTTADVVDFVLLTDRLSQFDMQSTGVIPADVPESLADRYRLFLALVYGRKPVITGTFVKDAFPTMLGFLSTVRGGAAALAQKPLAIFDCCPSPPLSWSDLTCQALIDCARSGIPAEVVSMPLTGATAPVTLAGSLVQHTAENLSGIVIHQLAGRGAPIVYGGAPSLFDMRRGTTPLGAIETVMIAASYAEIGSHLGLPVHGYMGLSDAKSPDFQAGLETAMGMTLAALAGVNVVSGSGMLNFVGTQSMEKLVLDNEICAMVRRLVDGVRFREETAGIDVLRELTASKGFLTSQHTRRFFKQEAYYPSDVIDRYTEGDWEQSGSPDAAARAHKVVTRLLGDAPASLLARETAAELESIMIADAASHGVGAASLPNWRVRYP